VRILPQQRLGQELFSLELRVLRITTAADKLAPMTFDVLVIGGGVAGFAAALAARQRGARTALVSAAPGASALISGAWSGPLRAEIRDALAQAGYALMPASSPLVHERGRKIACDFAGSTHTGASPRPGAIVCGIEGLSHFNAHTLAKLWSPDGSLAARTVELPGTPASGWTSASLAAHIERSPAALLQTLTTARAAVIFPAVLGIESSDSVVNFLRDAGIEASEALAVSPSIPGWRLFKAMERALTASGVTLISGRAVLEQSSGGRVQEIQAGSDVVKTNSLVLATGKFLSGGISANEELREGVLDLPVWLEHLGDVFSAPDPLPLTDPVRTEPQPLLTAGVHTDESLRPVDRSGKPVFENVFVAGTIRAGWDAAHSGLGNCAENGWTAGVNASA
jgi:anaerobic glycerol-3-phosphate dehydrogenase